MLQELINVVPGWKYYLPTVKNREASGYFDGESFKSFHKLHQSTNGLIHKKGMPDCMRTELKTLLDICEEASSTYLSQGWYDRDRADNHIKTIEDHAKLLTRDYETGTSASSAPNSKTDVLGEGDFASPKVDAPPPPLDGDASARDAKKGEATLETYRMVNPV